MRILGILFSNPSTNVLSANSSNEKAAIADKLSAKTNTAMFGMTPTSAAYGSLGRKKAEKMAQVCCTEQSVSCYFGL